MRRLFLSICLLVIVVVLMSCQKKEDGMTFESIYTDKEITKIVYGKNGNFKELTDLENINSGLIMSGRLSLFVTKIKKTALSFYYLTTVAQ
ncbi:hypothetical protein ACFVRR_00445 [Gottfriedia sp. NPDC057948]|uniref:hypothetical protein n=1 Tax=Gottfriedia sp. NPDC057948 TaxID=3346287 RepID=UPI0036DF95B2